MLCTTRGGSDQPEKVEKIGDDEAVGVRLVLSGKTKSAAKEEEEDEE